MQKQPSINKITRPTLPKVFPRKRLFRLLDQGRQYPVTWVTGPPGSGKTTLVASYLDSRKLPCLWYQVDEGDADIATFFYYMGLAVKKTAPRIKKPLPLLTPEYQFGIPTFTRRYFEDFFSRMKPPHVIVFDNYQQVPAESPFHEVMLNGLSEISRGIKVIVISRSEPPTVFARLEANKIMNVIGWEQLRLTPEETSGMMKLRTGKPVSKESLQKLNEKTSGWAAGVVLMEVSLRRGSGQIEPEAMEPGKISEYFAGEVFDKLDLEMQQFLLKTSYLPRMMSRMAEEISGTSDAGRILGELNRRNYFTERRSQPELSYQYHALFREFLLTRAEHVFSKDTRDHLRLRAAKLFQESGQIEDAAELYIGAGNWEGLGRLVLANAKTLMRQGRSRTLLAWLAAMPRDSVEADPWLLYWKGTAGMQFDLRESRNCLERAYGLFKKRHDAAGLFLSWAGIVDTYIYEWSDFKPLDKWIFEAEMLLSAHRGFPAAEIEARFVSGMFCALMYRRPHHPGMAYWVEKAGAVALRGADIRLRTEISSHLALYYTWWSGEQEKAGHLVKSLGNIAASPEITPLAAIVWYSVVGVYHWVTCAFQEGIAVSKGAVETAGKTGIHLWDFMVYANLVYNTLTQGDYTSAKKYLDKMSYILTTERSLDISHYHFLKAYEALVLQSTSLAREHISTALRLAEEAGVPFICAIYKSCFADVLIDLGEFEEAEKHLIASRDYGFKMKSNNLVLMYHWLEARILLARNKRTSAVKHIRSYLEMSRIHKPLNLPWWRSSIMAPLLAEALDAGIEVEQAQKLILRHSIVPDASRQHVENWPWPFRINTLGRFELLKDGKPLRSSGKVQKKPLEMLKALIAFGGREVQGEQIATALWPEADGDAAYKAFGVTIIRLRELLGLKDAVHLSEGNVTLDQRYFWIDTWAFEHMLESSEFGVQSSELNAKRQSAIGLPVRGTQTGNRQSEMNLSLLEKALELYKGPFLGAESATWAISLRERLRDKFLRCITALGMYREERKKWEQAIGYYKKGLEADDLVEEFYRRIIICHQRLGCNAEALSVYNRCKKTLAAYGVEPSSETEAVRNALLLKT